MGATVVDITERKRAESQLREKEERLRLATENAEVGFWDVDEWNQRLHWPPIVKAMFGISPHVPVTMQDFYDGLHPEDREATSAAYAAAADATRRELYDVEYRTVGKEDGVVRWVAAKGRAVFDANGRCLRVIGTAIDVTRRKQAEEQLRELNETLERRVAEALASRKILADVVDGTDMFVQVADLDFNWLAITERHRTNSRASLAYGAHGQATTCCSCSRHNQNTKPRFVWCGHGRLRARSSCR